jgi:hypothetical protein
LNELFHYLTNVETETQNKTNELEQVDESPVVLIEERLKTRNEKKHNSNI